jgi:hypothetical protein
VFPGVHVDLIFTVPFNWSKHWFWLRIFSIYLTGRTEIDCGLFRLSRNDTLILCTNFLVWNRAIGGCDRSTEDAYFS